MMARLTFPAPSPERISAANAVWTDPVSTLRWVPLSAYAADGKPATCSKGPAVQWAWGIVRLGCGDHIWTRYRRRRFSTLSVCTHRQLRPALRAKEAARPGKQALPWPISANPSRSACSLPAFRTIYMYPKKLPDHLISRRISGLIRLLIRRDRPAADQG